MMKLANLVTSLNIQIEPHQKWAAVGPESKVLAQQLLPSDTNFLPFNPADVPKLNGLLLAGALSAMPNAQNWLAQTIDLMADGATLLVVDWQYDGPLHYGPELEMRFKNGKLRRLLREAGFGTVEMLQDHSVWYAVLGVKESPPSHPHADKFMAIASLDELPKNAMKVVELFGHNIIVANTGKEIVAFAQTCPHKNALLNKGLLRGRNVVCPLHGYIWNVCTGEPVAPPDEDTLQRYPVKVDQTRGEVLVALAPPE